MNLDWFERAILGLIIFALLGFVYFLTEFVIAVAVFITVISGLGLAAEKLIEHIVEEEN